MAGTRRVKLHENEERSGEATKLLMDIKSDFEGEEVQRHSESSENSCKSEMKSED